ncbi:hypothetical protein [Paenisporosarcina sp. NPDC076898]|uniref:hypothetical protein n=1 Tax=unclassified Paenisporosarcina TaxID=2642018 RepID=UPI003CFE9D8F
MMKIIGWVLAVVLFIGVGLYSTTVFAYQSSKELFNFPVPKHAELVEESTQGKTYEWSHVSEEHGIPVAYEVVLKVNGWEKGQREGDSVYYIKGNHQIDVISHTDLLTLRKIK